MSKSPRILAFSGSLRRESFNTKLVNIAARGASEAGAEVTTMHLADHPLPVYNADDEASSGLPDGALALKELFKDHQGLLIASPEYNSSFSGALKNAIDWISRPAEGEGPLECFRGKIAGLMATSPGGLGGLRGLVPLRTLLANIHVTVLPGQIAISAANDAFDDAGHLVDESKRSAVEAIGAEVARVAGRLHASE